MSWSRRINPPELARKLSGNAQGKTTVMSAYEGWEVPDYGKPVIE